MTQENDTLLRYMSERLKQEPYISNPNSKNFMAEIATIIIHILQKDGKYNLQIDDCFNNFKDRILDYSIKKMQVTRNIIYFNDKDDTEISKVFLDMLDLNFSKNDIRILVQSFNDIETIDNDYQIILKKSNTSTDLNISKEKKDDKAFIINRATSETEIRQYFNIKIAEGYYTDIYKLLVDFTLMMYRRGAFSIDLSLPSFNSTITYINKLIKNYWIHSLPANELEPKFSYLWKTTKPIIINRAIDSLQIPYEINHDGSFIIPPKNEVPKIAEDNIATKEIKGEPVEDNEQISNNEDANIFAKSHIYPDNVVESKLSELFDVSETDIIEEEALLNEINSLLYSHVWENAYDLFGDIQYIIYIQKKLAESKQQPIQYVELKEFESKHIVIFRSHKKRLNLETRQDARRSLHDIWFAEYSISTVIKNGKIFESIDKIDKNGHITLKGYEVPKPADIKYDDPLKAMYDISFDKVIPEDEIIRLHKNLVQIKRWTNVADCIASISYIIINQPFYKDKGVGYPLLKSLIMKCAIIGEQDDLVFEESNHEHNTEIVRETLLQRYGIKELTDNYISIFGRYNVAEDGTIILDEPNKGQCTNTEKDLVHIGKHKDTPTITLEKQSVRKDKDVINDKLLELYKDSEKKIIGESAIIDLHKQLIRNKAWMNIADCISSIAYILIRQSSLITTLNGLALPKLKYLFMNCNFLINQEDIRFSKDNYMINREAIRKKLLQKYGIKELIELYHSIIGLYDVKDDGTIIFRETENESQNNTGEDCIKEIVVKDGTPVDLVEIDNSIKKTSQIETKVEPEKKLLESNQTNELLVDLYRNSNKYIINEQIIVDLHSQSVNSKEWSNISQCIASIAYVLIRQIEFANRPSGLKFKKLKNLFRKCIVIHKQDNLVFEDGNHLHNIGIVEKSLIKQYKHLLTVFFKEIIGSYNVATDGTIIFEEEKQEGNISFQNDTEDDSNDNNNSDGNVEKEEDDKKPQEPTTDIPEFDSNASYNEEGTNILLAKIEAYSNNSSIVEIFQYYFLDIQESFSHVKTKGELFEAYQHFKEYTAINFISKTHKEKLMEAFRCYIYYLLEINKK